MKSTSQHGKRTVRFVDDDGERNLHSLWIYEAYSTDVLWITNGEQKETRQWALREASALRQRGMETLLRDTFTITATNKSVQRSLNEFAKSKAHPRGLERFISREHYEVRKEHKMNAIKVIVMAQAEAKERGYQLNELTEQLRHVSIKFSVNAKIFARRMGKADEACCFSSKSRMGGQTPKNEESVVRSSSALKMNKSASSSSLLKSELSQRQLHALLA